MFGSTHIRITNDALEELKIDLSPDVKSELLRGVVYPDEEKKRNGTKESHHYGRARDIAYNVSESRRNLIAGDYKKAFFYLGIALHYIQDSYVTCKSSDGDRHFDYENKMDGFFPNPDIEKSIEKFLSDQQFLMKNCLNMVKTLKEDGVKGRKKALSLAQLNARDRPHDHEANGVIDLTLGYLATCAVVKTVVQDPVHCVQLDNDINRLYEECLKRLMDTEMQLSSSLAKQIDERNRLANTKNGSNGIMTKIRNWGLKRKIHAKDETIRSFSTTYFNRDPLKNIIMNYQKETEYAAQQYEAWYSYRICEMRVDQVPQTICQIKMADDAFGMIEVHR